ncbi:hypothetical protein DF107_26495 [Burkholderia stagnalis]|uniref:hypothetical protein n=1 Tax=Burkholderia stagnalis TaxID=1503054 RepID=UPI0009BE22C6|nr:hypothetical protein [Burkholderia stagnalis]RQQ01766.1 hypothetical protein DF164_27320 [Burkholderia stagnalis]RQQ09793.1 hypothetical protein DF161_26435 [Burkholderia stagnalis]RQQ29534.1 hypothetical protein DF148_23805 [Burkholderia stagnalis]RQQ97570.1 hypothetical protein DF031_25355 [Burkholderia stagnalis]RQX87729.1 hypothetical protein DF120_25960 [Burkholderia stagnalis]
MALTRHMQVLSDDIRRRLSCKAVDLHHSFSPGFKGAKPFHQPFERSDLPDFSGPLPAAAAELVRVVVPSTGQRDEGNDPVHHQIVSRHQQQQAMATAPPPEAWASSN